MALREGLLRQLALTLVRGALEIMPDAQKDPALWDSAAIASGKAAAAAAARAALADDALSLEEQRARLLRDATAPLLVPCAPLDDAAAGSPSVLVFPVDYELPIFDFSTGKTGVSDSGPTDDDEDGLAKVQG